MISRNPSYNFTLQQIIIQITDSTDFHFLMIALVFPRQFGAHVFLKMSQGHVIDIMTYNSYSLQYYSFRIIGI